MAPDSEHDAHLRLDVAPFEPDGGFEPVPLLLSFVGLLAVAAGLGYLASLVQPYVRDFQYGLVLGISGGLCGAVWLAIGLARCRHGWLAAQVGYAAGIVGVLAFFYSAFLTCHASVEQQISRLLGARLLLAQPQNAWMAPFLAKQRERLPPRVLALAEDAFDQGIKAGIVPPAGPGPLALGMRLLRLRDPQREAKQWLEMPVPRLAPEVTEKIGQAVRTLGFSEYLDWKAREGTTILIPRVRARIELGYAATWVYWGIELLLAGVGPAALAYYRTQRAYCTDCGRWKKERVLGRLAEMPGFVELVSAGEIGPLAARSVAAEDGPIQVNAYVCPACGAEAPIDIRILLIAKEKKGKESSHQAALVTYPGEALRIFEAMTAVPAPEARP